MLKGCVVVADTPHRRTAVLRKFGEPFFEMSRLNGTVYDGCAL